MSQHEDRPTSPDVATILGGQILAIIRSAGVSKMEAYAALSVAQAVLPTISEISFRNDLQADPDA
jgi:hypothetical protein